jgi:hypothetical protein
VSIEKLLTIALLLGDGRPLEITMNTNGQFLAVGMVNGLRLTGTGAAVSVAIMGFVKEAVRVRKLV